MTMNRALLQATPAKALPADAALPRRACLHAAAAGLGLLALGAARPLRAQGTVAEQLQLTGAVKTPLALSLSDLRGFAAEQQGSFIQSRSLGEGASPSAGPAASSTTVRGVRLSALVERAGLEGADRNDWKRAVILATARDGYRVAFSWPELVNTEVGAGVLVVFERDGQPLPASEGPFALVSAKDVRSGPRHVKWLTQLELRLL